MIFTTSWDDGRKDDLRLAKMLSSYGATGTFYVSPPATHGKPSLMEDEIRELSKDHEIGAHSMTHPHLTRIPGHDARREIEESKLWIEGITGKPCTMFCYPSGNENTSIRNLVRGAGFRGARTVQQFAFRGTDPFALPTTLKVYPLPLSRFFPRRLQSGALALWLMLAKALFLYAKKTGRPFFHLWGHSWEVERYGMWWQLEAFLRFVQKQKHVTHAPNSAIV